LILGGLLFRLVVDWSDCQEAAMTVGAYEAKTHLSQLLDRVAKGERIVITKHGVPVAVLQPPDEAAGQDVRQALGELRSFRAGLRTEGKTASATERREWTKEGRG